MKKIAIITGASTGLGKYVSIKLANKNYNVVIIARNKKKLENVKNEIINSGNVCSMIAADISQESSIVKIYSKIDNPKDISILVNNAGIGIFNKIQNLSVKEWDSQINTNLKASFLMTKMVINDMIDNKKGRIVFINSVAGINPYPYSSAYVASKFGLRGFSSSLREELREHNIKVISIHPGAINTPFWNNSKVDFPLDEMLSSNDVADSIVSAILAKNNVVHEEVVIRRTAGDF